MSVPGLADTLLYIGKNPALLPITVQRAVEAALQSGAPLDPLSQAPAHPFGINQALVPFTVHRAVGAALPSGAFLDPLSQAPVRPFGINQALVPFIEQHAGRQHCRLVPCTHNRALRPTPTIL